MVDRELTDDEVFGSASAPAELSDEDVFGAPAVPVEKRRKQIYDKMITTEPRDGTGAPSDVGSDTEPGYLSELGKSIAGAAIKGVGDTFRGGAVQMHSDKPTVDNIEASIAAITPKSNNVEGEKIVDNIRAAAKSGYVNPVAAMNYEAALRALWRGDVKARDEYLATARKYASTEALEENPYFQGGTQLNQKADATFGPAPGWEKSWTTALGQGLGSTVGFVPLGMAGGPAAVALFGGAQSTAQQYDVGANELNKVRDGSASPGSKLRGLPSEEQARLVLQQAKVGAVPGMTEDLPIEFLLHQTANTIPGLKALSNTPLFNKVVKATGRVLTQALAEGGQEYAQQVMQNFITKLYLNGDQQLTEQAWDNALVGALTGGFMQGVTEIGGTVKALASGPGKGDLPPGTETPPGAPPPGAPPPGAPPPGGPSAGAPPSGPNAGTPAPPPSGPGAPPPPPGSAPRAPDKPPAKQPPVQTDHDVFGTVGEGAPPSMHVNTAPTEAQKAAGNYKKGHANVQGLNISIENPQGSARTGKSPDGTEWSVNMPVAYGYFKKTRGADGDHVDVFLGPKSETSDKVFVIDQIDHETGNFDELKTVMGADSADEAVSIYKSAFSDNKGEERIGHVSEMSVSEFKKWLSEGGGSKPLGLGIKDAWKRDARRQSKPGTHDLAANQAALPQSQEQEVPSVRRPGDNNAPGVGGELSGVPPGRGQEASQGNDAGPQGQQQGVRAGQYAVDDVGKPVEQPQGPSAGDTERRPDDGGAGVPQAGAASQGGGGKTTAGRPNGNGADTGADTSLAQQAKKPGGSVRVIARRDVGDDEAITASGRRVPVKYAVVEAADLVPSQNDDGNANPAYPAELQPRDRERRMSGAQVHDIASKLEPRWLDKSAKASDGAPIVAEDGVVESGNGRTLAIRRAYERGMPGAERYRAYLKEQGYPVDGMERPVLVRVRQGDMTTEERISLAEDANEDDKLDLSTPERAMIDARRLTDSVLQLYRGGDVDEAGNREFTKAFLDKVASKGSRGKMVDDAGVINQDGMKRIGAALLAKAYGDSDLVGKLMESTDVNIKGIGSALLDVAGSWAQMRGEAAAGRISKEVDQTKALLEAVRIVDRSRREGKPIATFVQTADIFSGTGIAVETEFFLRLMYRNDENWKQPVSRKSLSEALTFFVTEARKTFEGTDLLGETAPKSKDILSTAKRKQVYDYEGDAADQEQLDLTKPQRPVKEDGGSDGEDAGQAGGERDKPAVGGDEEAPRASDEDQGPVEEPADQPAKATERPKEQPANEPVTDRPVADQSADEPRRSKPTSDRVAVDAGQSSDGAQGVTAAKEPDQAVNVEAARGVVAKVVTAIQNREILKSVIEAVPVDVMNMLIGTQWTPEGLLRDPAMLRQALTVPVGAAVSPAVLRFADAVLPVSNTPAFLAAVAGAGPNVGVVTGEGTSADNARQGEVGQTSVSDARATAPAKRLVSDERAAELRQRLKDKLRNQFNSGIDPEMLAIGAELAVWHIENGVRRFAELARAIARDLDVGLGTLRPYLRGFYNGARDLMEDNGLDVSDMEDAETVKAELAKLFGQEAKAATPEPAASPAPAPVQQGDPLDRSGPWREADIVVTLDDGSKDKMNAGQAVDLMKRRIAAVSQLLECVRAA